MQTPDGVVRHDEIAGRGREFGLDRKQWARPDQMFEHVARTRLADGGPRAIETLQCGEVVQPARDPPERPVHPRGALCDRKQGWRVLAGREEGGAVDDVAVGHAVQGGDGGRGKGETRTEDRVAVRS